MHKKRFNLMGFIFLLTISLLVGCAANQPESAQEIEEIEEVDVSEDLEEDQHVIFQDGRGEEVAISKNPEKVVILYASFIDIWINNGGENIVGMVEPSEEYIIPQIDNVATVGKRGSISLEEVIALDPDLVILSSNTSDHLDMIPSLESAGAEILALDYVYKDDYFKIAELFATINDKLDVYKMGAQKVKDGIAAIIDQIPEEDNPSVVIIRSTKSNTTVRTANTTIGEMFKDLKVINIVDKDNTQEGSKDFSLEMILEEDPDYIFLEVMGSDVEAVKEKIKTDIQSNPAWSSLSAVKNDRYIVLPKDLYTYKANDRYEEAYKNLALILYPGIFE